MAEDNERLTYTFVLEGEITPYVRMTRRGKFVSPRAQKYLASQEALRLQFIEQMQRNEYRMIEKRPFAFSIHVLTKRGYTFDLDNVIKAILDAAQKVVFSNDMWMEFVTAVCLHNVEDEESCLVKFRTGYD